MNVKLEAVCAVNKIKTQNHCRPGLDCSAGDSAIVLGGYLE